MALNPHDPIAFEYYRLIAATFNIADSPYHVTDGDIFQVCMKRGGIIPFNRQTRQMLKSKLKPKKPIKWPSVPTSVPDTTARKGEHDGHITDL